MIRIWARVGVVAVAAVIGLAGCTSQPSDPQETPQESSDAEAPAPTGSVPPATPSTAPPVAFSLPPPDAATGGVPLVGREVELEHLRRHLGQALAGRRQVVFVTGEAGRGKTALVEAFLAEVRRGGGVWIGCGQCLAHRDVGEPYLPLLDALGRLAAVTTLDAI